MDPGGSRPPLTIPPDRAGCAFRRAVDRGGSAQVCPGRGALFPGRSPSLAAELDDRAGSAVQDAGFLLAVSGWSVTPFTVYSTPPARARNAIT